MNKVLTISRAFAIADCHNYCKNQRAKLTSHGCFNKEWSFDKYIIKRFMIHQNGERCGLHSNFAYKTLIKKGSEIKLAELS